MTNPSRTKSVLYDGTEPNYQTCVCEENSASLVPGALVHRSAVHSPNGIILAIAESPHVNTAEFDLGIIECAERRSESATKWDWTTQIPDNSECTVHWLRDGDVVKANCTDTGAAGRAIGMQMIVGSNGTVAIPAADAAFDVDVHCFSVSHRAVADDDTIAIVKYVGIAPADTSA